MELDSYDVGDDFRVEEESSGNFLKNENNAKSTITESDLKIRQASRTVTVANSELNPNSNRIIVSYKEIVHRRKCMKWLPFHSCHNDLVYGSWWFLWGSILTVCIPIFPIISLFAGLWENTDPLPHEAYISAYGLLICSGLFYTSGSIAYIRAVEEPQLLPLFKWKHFATDELCAMWMFFVGSIFNIPCVGLYCFYNLSNIYYPIAFAIVSISTIFLLFLTYAFYPSERTEEFLSPFIAQIFADGSITRTHLASDQLIACWAMLFGSLLACIVSLGLLIYECIEHNNRGIFDYSTGFVDCFMFLVGSMYFTAGSYHTHQVSPGNVLASRNPRKSTGSATFANAKRNRKLTVFHTHIQQSTVSIQPIPTNSSSLTGTSSIHDNKVHPFLAEQLSF